MFGWFKRSSSRNNHFSSAIASTTRMRIARQSAISTLLIRLGVIVLALAILTIGFVAAIT